MLIPTNPMYDIDENGIVRLMSSGKIVPEYRNHNGRRAVKIRGKSHKESSHPLDRLMLLTYKPLPEDTDHEWLSVSIRDGDKDNVRITNLDWDNTWWYPDATLDVENGVTRWVQVYGKSQLEIRVLDGNILVRNSKTWRDIGFKVHNDYNTIIVPGEYGYALLHRLVALTLLPHPIDTDHLTVNHKDSNKRNNDPRNLEWATYSQNNYHAFKEGPRGDTVRRIIVKNISTGEETRVSGYNDAARLIGDTPQAVHQVIDRRTIEGRPYKGYVFKYEDDLRSWEELAKSEPRDSHRIPDKMAVRNMYTGDVKIYSSMKAMKRDFGIRDYMIRNLLNSKILMPWKGLCIQEYIEGKERDWPNYPKHILDVFSKTHSSDKPIEVIGPDGAIRYYSGVTEWCLEDRVNRCDPAVLSRYMKNKEEDSLQWRDWVFTYIDLSRYQ